MPNSQFQFPNMPQSQFPGSQLLKSNMLPSANFPNMNLGQGLTPSFNSAYNFPNLNQVPKNFGMNNKFFNNGFFGF